MLFRFSFSVCISVYCPNFSGFFPPFFSKVAAEGSGEGAMCFRAGAKDPVGSGWAPAVGQDSPGGIHVVRMGLGQGVKKDVDRDGLWQPLVQLRMGLALLCQGAPAGKGAAWACLPTGASRGANRRAFRRQLPPARNSQTRSEEGLLGAIPDTAHCRHMAPGAHCFCRLHV